MINFKTNTKGFTIVEIIVVIGLIGIIASITVVSYGGVKRSMVAAQMEADLRTAAVQLSTDFSRDSKFPDTKELANGGKGFKVSVGTALDYVYDSDVNTYCLTATSDSGVSYYIDSVSKRVISGNCPGTMVTPPPTLPTPPTPPVPTDSFAWGSSLSDSVADVTKTSDGGFAITGTTSSSGAGGTDMYISKYASDGSLTWSRTWGGVGNDSGAALVQSSDSGFAVVGNTLNYGNGLWDLFIAKFASDGSISWSKAFGSVENETPSDIANASDGGYLVSGRGYVDIGDYDMFTAKISSTGVVSWFKPWGTVTVESSGPVAETSDGRYLSLGSTTAGLNGQQVVIVKYRTNGNIDWSELWGSKYSEGISDILATPDGGAVLVGSRAGLSGVGDGLIMKIDSLGAVVWQKYWGGTGSDGFSSITLTSDGGYAVTGSTKSFGAGDSDMLIAKFNSDGVLIWNKTWGGTLADGGSGIVQLSSGNLIVIGNTSSFGAGGGDVFVAEFSPAGNFNNCIAPLCQTPTVSLGTVPGAAIFTTANGGLMSTLSMTNINVTPSIFSPTTSTINTF